MARERIKNAQHEARLVQTRILITFVIVLIMIAILMGRLYYLQVVSNDHFETLSNNNRIDLIPVPPVRGLVMDRNGEVLAQNFPVYTLEVIPDQVPNIENMVNEVGKIVNLTPRDLRLFRRSLKQRPGFERRNLRVGLSYDEASRFAVHRYRFQGES